MPHQPDRRSLPAGHGGAPAPSTGLKSSALRLGGALAAVTAAALLSLPTAVAAPTATSGGTATAPGTAASTVVQPLAPTAADEKAVRDYWTPARMAAVPSEPPSDRPPADGPDGAAWRGSAALSASVGRLFYTDRDGEDSSCTATLVAAANRSTVVTAAHCTLGHDLLGDNHRWNTNQLFVPGYRDATAPYGAFAVRLAAVHPEWVKSGENSPYDQAFLALGRNAAGQRAADAAGSTQRLGYDRPADRPVQQFGYPRASAYKEEHKGRPEFTGKRLAHCWGTPREFFGVGEAPQVEGQWGVRCDMGGGSSGGPRMAGFDASTGKGAVVGVNSMGARMTADGLLCESPAADCHRYLVGPQFTARITHPLFTAVQNS
ncbi:trypsin-like serine peptidase [Streptomyces katsurahamanus]|uniref:Peptidase n=1 Tax=Streptomyces katsurahamanus TaxID=2577098 RepID=A0ABW9NZ15_9ACTN|nr:peptidase [Streptomyces katsurahamanus]MQS38521.1 peptidase [Streptomyces katsurahamanus]